MNPEEHLGTYKGHKLKIIVQIFGFYVVFYRLCWSDYLPRIFDLYLQSVVCLFWITFHMSKFKVDYRTYYLLGTQLVLSNSSRHLDKIIISSAPIYPVSPTKAIFFLLLNSNMCVYSCATHVPRYEHAGPRIMWISLKAYLMRHKYE